MKKWVILILASILLACAPLQMETKVLPEQYGRVWCCCETDNGSCCGWADFCPGYVDGCFCK